LIEVGELSGPWNLIREANQIPELLVLVRDSWTWFGCAESGSKGSRPDRGQRALGPWNLIREANRFPSCRSWSGTREPGSAAPNQVQRAGRLDRGQRALGPWNLIREANQIPALLVLVRDSW